MLSAKKIFFFSVAVLLVSVLVTFFFFGCSSGGNSAKTTVSSAVTTSEFGDNDVDINDFFPGDTVAEITSTHSVVGFESSTQQSGAENTTKPFNTNSDGTDITEKHSDSASTSYTNRPTASSRPEYSTRQHPSTRPSATSPLESALQQADNSEGVSYGDIL